MALTYSQGYKRLLNGQSIKSISSSCPLRDPGGVCCVLRGSTKRGKTCSQEAYSLGMMNVRNQTWAEFIVDGGDLLSYLFKNRVTFYFPELNISTYQISCFSPGPYFPKALFFSKARQHPHFNRYCKTRTRASQISCDIYCTYPIRWLWIKLDLLRTEQFYS